MTQDRLAKAFLQLTVFLIPSSLAFRLYLDEAFIRGRLVDYLLPRLFLSDVTLILFILFLLLNKKNSKALIKLIKDNSALTFVCLNFWIFVSVTSVFSLVPISSLWYLGRITLMAVSSVGIFLWIKSNGLTFLEKPLLLLMLFQTALAIYQFATQSSLIGYALLGEPVLNNGNLAKSTFFGQLLILPYGTTPHPNVLSGVITVATLLLFALPKYNQNTLTNKVLFNIAICLLIVLCILTQSITSLLVVVVYVIYQFLNGKYRLRLTLSLEWCITLIVTLLVALALYQSLSVIDMRSITRRYMLFQTSYEIIKTHPLTGVGLNNFITFANKSGIPSPDPAIFLQPVHNIYVLWLVEAGFIGIVTSFWVIFSLTQMWRLRQITSALLPLIALFFYGLVDHWPITLQPGLLLISLTTAIAFASNNRSSQVKM
jgi:O-antigen ligase